MSLTSGSGVNAAKHTAGTTHAVQTRGVVVNFPHWLQFLSLEKDFVRTIEYVEVDDQNQNTFSVTYTKLLLSICSEIDVVAKLICKRINADSRARTIDNYRNEIIGKYPNFHKVEALIPRYGLNIMPWASWSGDANPEWWRSYNKVKHERDVNYNLASQKNVKEALCGLFCILLYQYQPELYLGKLEPFPALLDYERMPGLVSVNPGAELPDIPR